MNRQRYPGAQPFEKEQQEVFFGREEDLDHLRRKIKLSQLTVLYGKSGLGKSSLINAGLLPELEKEGDFVPVRVRFNAWQEQLSNEPVATTRAAISGNPEKKTFLHKIIADDPSLWRNVKDQFITEKGEKGLLLVFDQFEELFTYPQASIQLFKQQLAEALYTPAPQRYWDLLEDSYDRDESILEREELQLFQMNINLKVVIVVRSDRMHLLEKLSDYLPSILRTCQELEPLSRNRAKQAITEPAIRKGDFVSPRFTYSFEAMERILSFLTQDGTDPIETTQLQIICHHLEEKIKRTDALEVEVSDVENLDGVIEDYYDERISIILDVEQELAARRLVEEGLVFEEEERRLSLYEGQILRSFGLKAETLRILVDSHLLRAEPSLRGGYTYELSHDTLVGPVLKAKNIRTAGERAAAAEKQRLEQEAALAIERRKRRRAYLLAIIMVLLAAAAVLTTIIALKQKKQLAAGQEALLQSNFNLQKSRVINYKTTGAYSNALNLLDTIRQQWSVGPYHAGEFSESVLQEVDSLSVKYSHIQALVTGSRENMESADYRAAVDSLALANSISSDSYLLSLQENAVERLEKAFNDYVVRGELLKGTFDYQGAIEQFELALELREDARVRKLLEEVQSLQ
ncbi:nSTAND1 domain-containing NTPase [Flavilitoribacter nigricans]|uniref:Novel STAND NTPase 1 domain-containing protein n=1 Tax=Flavilitoribacter nigricans (strain ATCC 23147 / DSM 23189 / NBRC 102662 / NCIMB 1420 / SS-2) TaxID=1122177 RepID=A0A2D0N0N7_FLAN2|nr:hypothetical protein [Flavilitoribacter nigricans]PHN02000.1 hypothetical protein CRP01_34405 [Flavilitoribacter nigricans DSM 23189 = NBRC 102662]